MKLHTCEPQDPLEKIDAIIEDLMELRRGFRDILIEALEMEKELVAIKAKVKCRKKGRKE